MLMAMVDPKIVIACMALSSFAGLLAGWWWVLVKNWPRLDETLPGIELTRRQRLREISSIYKTLEPVIVPWAAKLESAPGGTALVMERIRRALDVMGKGFWTPGEWWAARRIEGIVIGLMIAIVPMIMQVNLPLCLIIGFMAGFGWPYLALSSEEKDAVRHKRKVVSQMVFGLDLMALMQEAGTSNFQECIQAVCNEMPNTELGREFARVDARISQGSTQRDALTEFDERMDDSDVQTLVLSVNTAEEKGSRLRDTLVNLAEQMRLRRIQWMERSAEEAKVHITWPAMCVMFGCLILVAGPVILLQISALDKPVPAATR